MSDFINKQDLSKAILHKLNSKSNLKMYSQYLTSPSGKFIRRDLAIKANLTGYRIDIRRMGGFCVNDFPNNCGMIILNGIYSGMQSYGFYKNFVKVITDSLDDLCSLSVYSVANNQSGLVSILKRNGFRFLKGSLIVNKNSGNKIAMMYRKNPT